MVSVVVVPMITNLAEAKANLSKLVDCALQGEEIVIAKNNLPEVNLLPHQPKGKRKLCRLKGQISFDEEDFIAADPEIEEIFYGFNS